MFEHSSFYPQMKLFNMKYTLLFLAILCTTITYAQSSKAAVHNALFDKLYQSKEVQSFMMSGKVQILKDANPCGKMDCALFSNQNKKRFPIWDSRELFTREIKSYIIVNEINYTQKMMKVSVKFQGDLMDRNANNLREITIQL